MYDARSLPHRHCLFGVMWVLVCVWERVSAAAQQHKYRYQPSSSALPPTHAIHSSCTHTVDTIQNILTKMFVYSLSLSRFFFFFLSLSPSFSPSHIYREEMRKELEIKFKKLMKERNEWYVYSIHTHTQSAFFLSTFMQSTYTHILKLSCYYIVSTAAIVYYRDTADCFAHSFAVS